MDPLPKMLDGLRSWAAVRAATAKKGEGVWVDRHDRDVHACPLRYADHRWPYPI